MWKVSISLRQVFRKILKFHYCVNYVHTKFQISSNFLFSRKLINCFAWYKCSYNDNKKSENFCEISAKYFIRCRRKNNFVCCYWYEYSKYLINCASQCVPLGLNGRRIVGMPILLPKCKLIRVSEPDLNFPFFNMSKEQATFMHESAGNSSLCTRFPRFPDYLAFPRGHAIFILPPSTAPYESWLFPRCFNTFEKSWLKNLL